MLIWTFFLLIMVQSPTRSSFVSSYGSYDSCPVKLSPEYMAKRSKRQTSSLQTISQCELPPYPEHGRYAVGGKPNAIPGQTYPSAVLNIACNPGFGVENNRDSLVCLDGIWFGEMPRCVRFCRLYKHPSVQYYCLITDYAQGSRICGDVEPSGTIVRPVCVAPNYYYPGTLDYMNCIDGNWDYTPICKPECGKITPEGIKLIRNGRIAYRGELPWHAGIYTKTVDPYMQICGGSLISTTTIISAAHCFWSDESKLLPASEFAVAVGKIYRPWNDHNDPEAQTSDVARINVTPYFRGASTNFQDDIALVIVSSPFTYQLFIRPVCLDFDETFDKQQLYEYNMGKVAGWGLVDKNGAPSQTLKVVEMPFISIDKCYKILPPSFKEYITNDKICAGYTNGTALCQGDSGGGLAFPASERGAVRYYLRGVVSTAPKNADLCTTNTLTTYTQVFKHEHFIKKYIHVTSSSSSVYNGDCLQNEWLCRDGSRCISVDRRCDLYIDCPDGSDEMFALCRKVQTIPQEGKCVLPSYPMRGTYTVGGNPNAEPGHAYPSAFLNISCSPGFDVENGRSSLFCYDGVWSGSMPECVRSCRLEAHASVEYRCQLTGALEGSWEECGREVRSQTIVRPVCRSPDYYYPRPLSNMKCVDGVWNYTALCKRDCGRPSTEAKAPVPGRRSAMKGEVPWHAGIYRKTTNPFSHVCGGSLISTTAVISAAHCFWNGDKTLPTSDYTVALGKIYREWGSPKDTNIQTSDVIYLKLVSGYNDAASNYANDLAVLKVMSPFTFNDYVRPICVDFDETFDNQQLQDNNVGKVAGWSNVDSYQKLKVVGLGLNTGRCASISPEPFRQFITSDKLCAGNFDDDALCPGIGGSGLVFSANDDGELRFYLRGVVSVPSQSDALCRTRVPTTFTRIIRHKDFIDEQRRINNCAAYVPPS